MVNAPVATAYRIEVDGQPLDPAVEPNVLHVIVDDHLLLPDTFEIALQETPRKDVAGQAHIRVGTKIVISGRAVDDNAPTSLISGEVTALEGEYREAKAPTLVVRGYDQGHRLMHGRKSAVYRQQKYSDIAQAIAAGLGLQVGTIADSQTVVEYVLQAGQTDWEFLNDLASEIGFQVAVTDAKFSFAPPTDASAAPGAGDLNSTDPLQLVFGEERLREFRPRVTAGGQVAKVTVRGWDMAAQKELIKEEAAATTSVQLDGVTPASISAIFGSPGYVSGNRPRTTQAAVDAAAKALKEQLGSAFAEATGIAKGNPKLKAGASVNVSRVAAPFAGCYRLSHTRHVFDKDGYRTYFEVSGRQERTLLGLASGAGGGAPVGLSGVQIGVVTENADPQNLGRVRMRLPYLGSDFVTGWARVVAPGNGKDRGFVWIPEINDEVLVAFHHGDVSEPYILGGLWNGQHAPPPIEVNGGELQARKLVSRTGQKIVLSDESGKEGILISSADGSIQVHVDVANKKVVLISDGGGTVEMKSGGDFTIESQGSVKISGVGGVEISSPANTKVSGTSGLSLESGAVTSVKGSQVSLG